MQEFEFVDNRRAFRFVGILLLILGLLATYVIFSGAGRTPDTGRPDIRLPKIGALPPGGAPKMPLLINRDHETRP